ncbi:MAG: hypothetical protein CM1200mP39_06900 [Dehalococcoidia bacterium]|nr:MAG: hypothetical protein CM1200mP39_06900 [Dehalococcoidia bacterium]
MASDLSGKRIIVTGAATGIGRATTLAFLPAVPKSQHLISTMPMAQRL